MMEIWGKQVRETLEELLDPPTTALLVIDMQVGGVHKDGTIGESGSDLSMMPTVRRNCGEAIELARQYGVRVVHVRVANLPNAESSPPAWLRTLHNIANGKPIDIGKLSVEGNDDLEFCEECMPEDGEWVITKRRPSAFVDTDLARLLRNNGIESVAVIGVSTPGCVEATVRDASHSDFYTVVISDAVGAYDREQHDAAMTVMSARHDVCTLAQAAEAWAAGAAPVQAAS